MTSCYIQGIYKTGVETTNLAITRLVMIDVENVNVIYLGVNWKYNGNFKNLIGALRDCIKC